MKTSSFILSFFACMQIVSAYEQQGMSPMELHQAYVSGMEKINQYKSMNWQQVSKRCTDIIHAVLIGAGAGYAFKTHATFDAESWMSSSWISRAGCALVGILVLKDLYGFIAYDRAAFAQLAAMKADLEADYQRQMRYMLLGDGADISPVVEPSRAAVDAIVESAGAAEDDTQAEEIETIQEI